MNIVSIDFDIIMAPSIELYRNFDWRGYDNYYQNIFNADLTIYTKLTEWLLRWFPQVGQNNIYFIESHEQIIDFIPKDKVCSLINVDHHHDLGYAPFDQLDRDDFPVDCGNWALYLLKHNLINDYTWIKNGNSSRCQHYKYDFNSKLFYDFNFNELQPDRIIICLSSPWVPLHYHTLFNLWMTMAGKLNNTQYYLIENR